MKCFELPETLYESETYLLDKNYRVGKLPNGLTYYIRHNEEPQNRCNMEIVQRAGSMQEEESQRGLAHLLEHMGFNSLEHTPDIRLRDFLEKYGIRGGNCLNARTSRHYTHYYIYDIPTNTGNSVLDDCLNVVADWSGGILLKDEEIAKERNVVKTEYQRSQTAISRMHEKISRVVTQNHLCSHRSPIGLLDVIENSSNDELISFYRKWYHPANQCVIVVGDVDVDEMERKIVEVFSRYKSPENPAPVCDVPMQNNFEPIFACAYDKEYSNSEIEVICKFANPFKDACVQQRFYIDILFRLIQTIVGMRLYDREVEKDSKIISTGKSVHSFYGSLTMHEFEVSCVAMPGCEDYAYRVLLSTLLDICGRGFGEQELVLAKRQVLRSYERSFAERKHIDNESYCDNCFDYFLRNSPLYDVEASFRYAGRVLDYVGVDVLNSVFRSIVSVDGRNMITVVYSEQPADGAESKNEDFYKAIAQDVYGLKFDSGNADNDRIVLVENLPEPGKVLEEEREPLFGANVLKLQNGVKVMYKVTDFRDDEIKLMVVAKGGTSQFDVEDFPNFRLVDNIELNSGLGNLSESQLSKYFKGISINYDLTVEECYSMFTGFVSAKDLEFMMEVIYSYFTNPGHNVDDFHNFIRGKKNSIAAYNKKPSNAIHLLMDKLSLVDNSRDHFITIPELDKIDFNRVIDIHKEIFADASQYTFYFVGNINDSKFKQLVEKYLAVLPSTCGECKVRPEVILNKYRSIMSYSTIEMVEPMSRIMMSFLCYDIPFTIEYFLLAHLLGDYMSNKITDSIRNQASISYSSGANMKMMVDVTKSCKGIANLVIQAEVQPEYGFVARKLAISTIQKIIEEGVQEEDFRNLKTEYIQDYDYSSKLNDMLLSSMRMWMDFGIDMYHDYMDTLDSITLERLNEFVRKYFADAIRQTFIVMPEGVEQKTDLDIS